MQSRPASMTTLDKLGPSLTGRIRISTVICYASHELVAIFPSRSSVSHWPRWRATASYESGAVRKMRATLWQSVGGNARDRCVFLAMHSCCTDRVCVSFLPRLQEVRSIDKTRNQFLSIPRLFMIMAKDGEVAHSLQPLLGGALIFLGAHGGQMADAMIEA